jgi:hypothetical protein
VRRVKETDRHWVVDWEGMLGSTRCRWMGTHELKLSGLVGFARWRGCALRGT